MLSSEPKAEADNSYRDFDYLGYHKDRTRPQNSSAHERAEPDCVLKLWGRDIVIGNHALRAQPSR